MVQDRNKLPTYQLILMPSSNSTNWSSHFEVMMTTQKRSFLQFCDFDISNVFVEVGRRPNMHRKNVDSSATILTLKLK